MVAGFSSTLARAKDFAQRRRQSLSTAHVLCALLQEDERLMRLCAERGLGEPGLFAALSHAHEERPNAIDLAQERARKLAASSGGQTVGLHLWLAIVRDARSAGALLLKQAGVSSDELSHVVAGLLQGVTLAAAPGAKSIAQASSVTVAAPERARKTRSDAAWLKAPRARMRRDHGLLLAEQTESKLQRRLGSAPHVAPATAATETPSAKHGAPNAPLPKPRAVHAPRPATKAAKAQAELGVLDPQSFPLLHALGRNLTQAAALGQIDDVIGREAEIDMLLDVLARRRGNNPVLVGPPGVGKTALVEGLALAMLHSRSERTLIELSASSLLAGTGVRGALSERVATLRAEVKKSDGRVLLFIDEIHTVIGGAEGDSLGNELKTALSRGELPVVGATTDAEYRRVFERDAALARRFTRIEVGEPTRADALSILRGVAPHYERHHAVRYDDAALSAAVELSVRYLTERQLPDKAIALLDQAGARVHRRGRACVDQAAVASVVSELAGVSVERLLMQDGDALLSLETHLAERVVGQTAAVSCIANALRKSAAGFRGARPLGTFLFLGPTGVGKTEMAKAIAERMFPGTQLTRIDMSELSEPHSVARLFGAPPGYVGHEDAGQLTDAVRHRPYQLVLLDEIEKAHPDVLLALLPLLDEGRLTDGRGRTVDFTNTVIVMTSNLGAESAAARARIGFGDAERSRDAEGHDDVRARERALSIARAAMPPELWNRIDEPLYFKPLSEIEVMKVARRMLSEVAKIALERHDVVLEVETSALLALVAAGGFDRALGARPMRRTISRLVEAPLSRALLAGEVRKGERVVLHAEYGTLEFSQPGRATTAAE